MASKFCPDCGGLGFVVVHYFALECALCKADMLGNKHLRLADFKNPAYVASLRAGQMSPNYWMWLKFMVENGHIDPDDKANKPNASVKKKGKLKP